jgi:hypothetical protein
MKPTSAERDDAPVDDATSATRKPATAEDRRSDQRPAKKARQAYRRPTSVPRRYLSQRGADPGYRRPYIGRRYVGPGLAFEYVGPRRYHVGTVVGTLRVYTRIGRYASSAATSKKARRRCPAGAFSAAPESAAGAPDTAQSTTNCPLYGGSC